MIVNDDDDAEGDCDHRTQAPEKGTYKMTVTNGGGSGGQGLCESCSTDAQCGGPNDTCFLVGGDPHCGRACSGGDCDAGYECSAADITSIDGKASRQCVPTSQSCGGQTTTCTDDMYEDNDDVSQVMSTPPLMPGSISAVMCNGADGSSDHDWFPFEVTEDTEFTVTVAGGSQSDIDLFIRDSAGMPVDGISGSLNSGSAESITGCVTAGRYYFRTRSYFKTNGATNPYTLSWSKVAKSCTPPPMCMDDMYEDDDNASQAYEVNPSPFMASDYPFDGFGQSICSWDEDWYKLNLPAAQDVKVTLKFAQASTNEDLDLLLYRGTTLLTPCDEFVPDDCDPNNGQSSSSNEIMRFNTETNAGEYFIVVRGWNGAENTYDLCIGLNETDCPDPT